MGSKNINRLIVILVSLINMNLYCEWISVGPQSDIGCIVYDIVQNPQDPQILYAASPDEGLFKSISSGSSWFRITNETENYFFNSLAINPSNPAILYAGTCHGSIYKSENSGENWIQIYDYIFDRDIEEIVIDPSNSNIVYAALRSNYSLEGGGILKSVNAGANWDVIADNLGSKNFHALTIDANNPNQIYAGSKFLSSCDGGFFKSEDGGVNWTQTSTASVTEIAINPFDSNIIIIGTSSNGGYSGAFRSVDAGESWQETSCEQNSFFQGNQNSIFFDSNEGNIVFLGMNPPNNYESGLFKSDDGGINWSSATSDLDGFLVFSVIIDCENSDIIRVATHDGHFNSFDAGITWFPANEGLALVKVTNILVYPDETNIWTASSNKGLFVTYNSGENWERSFNFVRPCLYHPQNNLLFGILGDGSFSDGIYTSDDNGLTWHVFEWISHSNDIDINPINPEIMFVPTDEAILRTTNGGINWSNADSGITEFPVYSINIDFETPENIYAISFSNIWKSVDSGNSWVALNCPFIPVENKHPELILNPQNSLELYLRTTNELLKSSNAGLNWSEIILPESEFTAFEIDSANPDILYSGFNGSGIFRSTDGGQSWENYSENLENLSILSLSIDPVYSSFLLAGTCGNGIAYHELETVSIDENENFSSSTNNLSIFPNPFNPSTTIKFSIQNDSQIELIVFNTKGQKIKSLTNKNFTKGSHSIIWNGDDDYNKPVSSGIYYYKLNVNGKTEAVKKCLLLK